MELTLRIRDASFSVMLVFLTVMNAQINGLAVHLPYGAISTHQVHDLIKQPGSRFHPNSVASRNVEKSTGLPFHFLDQFKHQNPTSSSFKRSRYTLTQKRKLNGDNNELFQSSTPEKDNLEIALDEINDIDEILDKELNYAQQLANGILLDLKTILEEEKANGRNSELIANLGKNIGQERLLRLS